MSCLEPLCVCRVDTLIDRAVYRGALHIGGAVEIGAVEIGAVERRCPRRETLSNGAYTALLYRKLYARPYALRALVARL